MSFGIYNIDHVIAGAPLSVLFELFNPDGTPQDLTGSHVKMQVRKDQDPSSPAILNLNDLGNGIILTPTPASIEISLDIAQTLPLAGLKMAFYDMFIQGPDSDLDPEPFMIGQFQRITKAVTVFP